MKNINVREFNRLYKNLVELCKRIYDEKDYPRTICANWFVNALQTLLDNQHFIELLKTEQVDLLIEMSINIRSTEYLDIQDKKLLTEFIKELKSIKVNLTSENYVK